MADIPKLPQNVVSLVIAAREAFDTGMLPDDEQAALDKALEPFASAVPYENEPTRAAPPAMDREAVESAFRIGIWNACRERCLGADSILHIVETTLADPAVARALSTLSADAIRQGEGKYLVWSNEHRAWWGSDHRGYTRVIERAGRYDRDEAFSIASKRGGGWEREANPDEIAIPEADAIAQYVGPRLATPASHASNGGE